jgi:hypothetical protein
MQVGYHRMDAGEIVIDGTPHPMTNPQEAHARMGLSTSISRWCRR